MRNRTFEIRWKWSIKSFEALPHIHRLLNLANPFQHIRIKFLSAIEHAENWHILRFVIGTTEMEAVITNKGDLIQVSVHYPKNAVGDYLRRKKLIKEILRSIFIELFDHEYSVVASFLREPMELNTRP
jgi:hypothetical protein